MQDFRSLRVWHEAHALTLAVYRATAAFPREERYGITVQVRRSTASIAANLAEGCGRGSDADFARFVQYALGPSAETRYHLLLAHDLGWLPDEAHRALEADLLALGRQLCALRHRLSGRPARPCAPHTTG